MIDFMSPEVLSQIFDLLENFFASFFKLLQFWK